MHHEIIKGDALTKMRWLRGGEGRYKAIITSPPYNLMNSRDGGWKRGNKKMMCAPPKLVDGYAEHDDNMPHEEYVAWQRECLTAMWELLTDDGAIFYNHTHRIQYGKQINCHEILEGFPLRQTITWDKLNGFNFNRSYFLPTAEYIYLIAKPDFKIERTAVKYGTVWRLQRESNNTHPAPFPVSIPARIIESCGLGKDDWVLDPFCGSGTTLVAAKQAGINAMGIELSEKYVAMARARLADTML